MRPLKVLHERIIPGASGSGMTTAEYTTLRNDINTILTRPAISFLTDIPDVVGTPSDGDVLIYNGADAEWQPGAIEAGLGAVYDASDTLVMEDVRAITAKAGVTARAGTGSDPNHAVIEVQFDGTGTSNKAARADHTSSPIVAAREEFGPAAYMSSGTRSLKSTSITLADGVRYLVVATLTMQMRGADPGPCYYRQTLTIGGVSQSTPSGSNGFWGVQGVPDRTPYTYRRWINGTGTAITISASVSYDGGGGFYTDHGVLEITAYPNR